MNNNMQFTSPRVKWLPGVLLVALFLLFSATTHAACTAQSGMRDDVLIVVNANSVDSPQVGDYYCQQRGIDPANIATVYLPGANDVSLDQFIALRDQLIRFLQLNTLSGNEVPVVCDTSLGYTKYYCPQSVDQIRRLTRIRYLVMTSGVPIRFIFTGSALPGGEPTSIDNYLRYWLLNYYPQDSAFPINSRAIDFGDGRGMRTVAPVQDREFIVGRIDGITAGNAMQLVDRAITAERNGVYGKLVSTKFGSLTGAVNSFGAYWKQWLTGGQLQTVYPSWHYLHGLFGELQTPNTTAVTHTLDPECLTNDASGISPQDCVTRLTEGGTLNGIVVSSANDPPPGTYNGVIPRPDHSLVYQGYIDGATSVLDFGSLLNWRDSDSCSTLCAAADTACKAASTDVYREIDTRCVRVADGFMGYNMNSWPVGSMYGSPTGWYVDVGQGTSDWYSNTSANQSFRAPKVRDYTGFDDSYSLWFENSQQLPTARCYASGDDLQLLPQASCSSAERVMVTQRVNIAEQAVNLTAPQVITVRFKYRALNLTQDLQLHVRLLVHESVYSDSSVTIAGVNQINYKVKTAAMLKAPQTPADGTSWGDAVASFTLDPALHQHPQYLFDGIKIRIQTPVAIEGQLAIDTVTLDVDGVDIPLQNDSFNDGHRQISGGDSAASFLGRLNGTAFWASLTHHGPSNGRSFEKHPYETLIYFLRGLPLGDAVWFAENNSSGILYGDPLYSPIAVHLHYLPGSITGAPQDTFNRKVPMALQGDTVNGTGSDVTTTYSVSYCAGKDFFVCDQGQTWVPIANMQNLPGGSRNMSLGSWNATQLAEGDYTLRLAVTSTNATSGLMQTFNDYYPLTLQDLPATPVDLSGTIKTAGGIPICAVVLASGKYMFSCNPVGDFALFNLPRMADGRIKLQIYADGFKPYTVYLDQSGVHNVVMSSAGVCPNYNPTYTPVVNTAAASQRVYISGQILVGQTLQPVCAMVLANGQHMFSCGGSGDYSLNIPLDSNGQLKLQVYATGFAPYKVVLDPLQLVNTVKLARASECQ